MPRLTLLGSCPNLGGRGGGPGTRRSGVGTCFPPDEPLSSRPPLVLEGLDLRGKIGMVVKVPEDQNLQTTAAQDLQDTAPYPRRDFDFISISIL